MKTQQLFYIDNLRIFLTALVVAHHWATANGAPGDWYFTESSLGPIGSLLFSLFVATNQAFFMGFSSLSRLILCQVRLKEKEGMPF